MSPSSSPIDVSILVPVCDERESLRGLMAELVATLERIEGLSWEVMFVDDGSRDGSDALLRELAAGHEQVRVVQLSRNYGQTAALDAALQHARGAVLVPMDADGQNDPADVPRLLGEIARGADVVSGWRRARKDPLLSRRIPSWIANRLISSLTGVPIHDFGCTLKAYRRSVLANVRLVGEMHRFIPAYAHWNGARVVELEVHHRPRGGGRSKYGIGRTFKVLLDLITVMFLQTGWSSRPLHLFGGVGLLLSLLAFGLAGWIVREKLAWPLDDPRHVFVHRNPLTALAALCLILGAGAVALGLMSELLVRIYHATTARPYSIAGGRNLPDLITPEEAQALPEAIARLAAARAQDPLRNT